MTHVLKHALLLDEKSPLLFQSIQKKKLFKLYDLFKITRT